MVFVIQNSANRSSKATALKLDELIRAVDEARNEFISLDHATETELVEAERELDAVAEQAGRSHQPAERPAAASRTRVRHVKHVTGTHRA